MGAVGRATRGVQVVLRKNIMCNCHRGMIDLPVQTVVLNMIVDFVGDGIVVLFMLKIFVRR